MQADFYQRDYLDIVGLAATRANTLSMGHASGKKSPWLLDKTPGKIPLFFVAFFLMLFSRVFQNVQTGYLFHTWHIFISFVNV